MATYRAMLGPIAPTGASSRRAMSSVASAATNVATTASVSAAPIGFTGTTADRSTCGAFDRSRPRVAIALALGIPATVSDGSSTMIASHAPTTTVPTIVATGFQRRRSPTNRISAGSAAASNNGATQDAPE